MKEERILIEDLKVNYKIAGQGPAILVLHGWGGSSGSWSEVQKILAARGYTVVCPDFPGFGKSIFPKRPWGIDDYSRLVLNFSKKLGLEEFFLLGHSFGGRVAIRFAIQYPEKLKSLILCNSAGIKPKLGLKAKLIYWIAKIGNAIFTPRHIARFKDTARNIFYSFLHKKDYVKAKGVMKETIKMALADDLLPDLEKIKMRTLIVWGGKDKMVPPKYAETMKKNIKNSRLEIFPKVGHSPHLEAPEKLSELILKFLK
jgi:pimeloyl-ACP methyl ester carboxylesterase